MVAAVCVESVTLYKRKSRSFPKFPVRLRCDCWWREVGGGGVVVRV